MYLPGMTPSAPSVSGEETKSQKEYVVSSEWSCKETEGLVEGRLPRQGMGVISLLPNRTESALTDPQFGIDRPLHRFVSRVLLFPFTLPLRSKVPWADTW